MDVVLPAGLDVPVWSALNGRWRLLAQGDDAALRLDPAIGPFAAARDEAPDSQSALAALCVPGEEIWLVQRAPIAPPPGLDVVATPELLQMAAPALTPGQHSIDYIELGAADGAEMHALASLTRPGPFEARTHELGGFIGVRSGGRLIAMAGERMRPDGACEVSGVCTHPDHRGCGLARALMAAVARRIVARGDMPFLHVYPSNVGAIALYESLGFTIKRPMHLMIARRPAAD